MTVRLQGRRHPYVGPRPCVAGWWRARSPLGVVNAPPRARPEHLRPPASHRPGSRPTGRHPLTVVMSGRHRPPQEIDFGGGEPPLLPPIDAARPLCLLCRGPLPRFVGGRGFPLPRLAPAASASQTDAWTLQMYSTYIPPTASSLPTPPPVQYGRGATRRASWWCAAEVLPAVAPLGTTAVARGIPARVAPATVHTVQYTLRQ